MSHNHTFCHASSYKYRIALTFVKPRGGEGQNGQLKCPVGFLVEINLRKRKSPGNKVGTTPSIIGPCLGQTLKLYTLFNTKRAKNRTLSTGTSPCKPYKGVFPRPFYRLKQEIPFPIIYNFIASLSQRL